MIISEKQIMQLLTIANGAIQSLTQKGYHDSAKAIAELIDTINTQQSEKLKVIE